MDLGRNLGTLAIVIRPRAAALPVRKKGEGGARKKNRDKSIKRVNRLILGHCLKHLEFPVALLVVGSAILLSACSQPAAKGENNDAAIITRTVVNMETLESKNGKNERIMRAPLVEEHALANPAYTEYTRGVDMTGFDSLGVRPASNIVADYAIHWSANELWELKGNVLAEGEDARKLYTQQLFYNARTGKVWSNVDCKFEMGEEVFVGVGFDAMVDMSYAAIRNITGYFNVEVEDGATGADSLAVTAAPVDPSATGTSATGTSSTSTSSTSTSSTSTSATSGTPATGTPATGAATATADGKAAPTSAKAATPAPEQAAALQKTMSPDAKPSRR